MADLCMHELHRCTICDPSIAPKPPAEVSRVFAARFDGTECAGCGFSINAGTPVRFVGERLHHAGCTDG